MKLVKNGVENEHRDEDVGGMYETTVHEFFLSDICATARPEHSKNTTSNDAAGKQYIYNKT